MKTQIECPYCDGQATLKRSNRELTYRKELFNVMEHFYKCEKCTNDFTTTETDTISVLQAHNQYREKHSIPFPEEIISIREKYGLSAAKMSEVLGLGINGYAIYERGEIPTNAIGNLIYSAANPEVFKSMLEKTQPLFSKNIFENVLNNVNNLKEELRKSPPFYFINLYNEPKAFTGYKRIDIDKVKHLFIAFLSNCTVEFNDRLKLNKLLFYADFLNYKETGFSLTGLSYRAIQYGPVPACYDNIFAYLENERIIYAEWIKEPDNSAREIFKTEFSIDSSIFTSDEQNVIDIICKNFKDSSPWSLVDLSHKEKAWIDLQAAKELINYQEYAFDLIGI